MAKFKKGDVVRFHSKLYTTNKEDIKTGTIYFIAACNKFVGIAVKDGDDTPIEVSRIIK
jgi:hypothetical protein